MTCSTCIGSSRDPDLLLLLLLLMLLLPLLLLMQLLLLGLLAAAAVRAPPMPRRPTDAADTELAHDVRVLTAAGLLRRVEHSIA